MIADEKQRRRAREETNHSFAVEASAGTGKTTTLVERILQLVLGEGPKGQPTPLSGICAITFTEKAAGEMKLRLRQEFEKRTGDAGSAGESARTALRDLESAQISTFHAFAVSLLKERPVEAGLDPRFTALDDAQRRLFFREVWEPWLSRALAGRCGPIEAALRSGIGLENLRDLARTLLEHAASVRRLKLVPPPTDAEVVSRKLVLLEVARGHRANELDVEDKLAFHLDRVIAWLETPEPGAVILQNPGSAGARGNWKGGKDTVEAVKEFVKEVVAVHRSCAMLPQQRLFDDVIHWLIGDFLAEWERRKRQNGFLDFDDQLESARGLLASSRAARSEFQKRFAALLVDEFQDTDPVQLEIVLLLSCTDLAETNPARLRPEPGRLFIVGDPKQSIYRFRGADIETYLETVEKARGLALERLELTTNFRSVPSILRFVDEAFCESMKQAGSYQPGYLSFGGRGHRKDEPAPPSVHILAERDPMGDFIGSGKDFAEIEASRIAGLVTRIHDGQDWMIEDRSPEPGRSGPKWRPARYGDIAILLPVLTRVDLLEEKLRAMGIPYVLEGGKFYYARSEVTSAVTALRAIANPNDAVALYGALRSIFFGLSDEDLLRAHLEGRPLDYRAEVPENSPLHRPYSILCELHLHRYERPASETFERLLRQTGAREVLAVRGFQSLANLAKLARTLRTIQQDKTYSQVVEILLSMDEEGVAESESRLMEEKSDAVRILSIHKAKGLDFHIVIAAGLGLQLKNQQRHFLADFHRKGVFALKLGSRDEGVQTPGWESLLEDERRKETAELTRLLYVALTRARDHLVLCIHTRGKDDRASGQSVPNFERTRWKPLAEFLAGRLTTGSGLARFINPGELPGASQKKRTDTVSARDWGAVLRAEQEELRRLLAETPHAKVFQTAAGFSGDILGDTRSGATARSRAARQGTVFHEAMERVDLKSPGAVYAEAAEAAERHQLDAGAVRSITEMMLHCLSSPLLSRASNSARSGRRVLKEIPYVRPVGKPMVTGSASDRSADYSSDADPGRRTRPSSIPTHDSATGGIEEGVIDLLFEEADGWVVVDYKTDLIPMESQDVAEHFRERYAAQVRRYVEALQAMNICVKAAYLLLARNGAAIEIQLES